MVNPRPLSPMANWRLPGVSAYREDVSHVLRPALQMPALPKRAFHVSDDRREKIAAKPQYRRSGQLITYPGNLLANCREIASRLPGNIWRNAGSSYRLMCRRRKVFLAKAGNRMANSH